MSNEPVKTEAPAPTPIPPPDPVVVNQQVNEAVKVEETVVFVENNAAPTSPAHPAPAKKGLFRRGIARCYHTTSWFCCLPFFWLRQKREQDSMTIYSVDSGFFLWAIIAFGWILSTCVRVDPLLAGACGWIYAWLIIIFLASIIYDLNAKKFALWAIIFFAVWMGLKYAQDVQHWIVLGTITNHLANLHPQLDPGMASVISWVLLIPWIYSLFHMIAFGRKRMTPNELVEYHFMEGQEFTDRQGIKFKTKYRDLLETILSFGGGDLVATDNHGVEYKKYPNILGLYFIWPKISRIIEQRAVVEDGGDPAAKHNETN